MTKTHWKVTSLILGLLSTGLLAMLMTPSSGTRNEALAINRYGVHKRHDLLFANKAVGTLVLFAGLTEIPENWVACEGQSLLKADYTELHAIVGSTYSAAPTTSSTFALPDYRGMFSFGATAYGLPVTVHGNFALGRAADDSLSRFGGQETEPVRWVVRAK